MYDLQRIGNLVADIEKYFKELKNYKIEKVEDLLDSKNFNASSMVIFAILNRLLDLGSQIITAENLGAPNTYQDTMPILAKAGLMNMQEAERLNELIKKRNIFAHYYGDIQEKELFKIIKEIQEVKIFVEKVKKRVKI